MSQSNVEPAISNRHQARQSAVEVLYAWQIGGGDKADIRLLVEGRLQERDGQQDGAYFQTMIEGVVAHCADLDQYIDQAVPSRSLASIGMIELAILRLGCWELWQRLEIPYRVVLNEALDLSHEYADDPVPAFINGVLDRLSKVLRKTEVTA
ncbi:MAG: transcription antitermination factor NusB [Mariprofundales bacterium]